MTGVALRIADGDVTAELPSVRRRDEIGILTDGFHAMGLYLRQTAATAKEIATGNLTMKIIPRSKADVLGNALVQMVEGLQRLTLNVKDAVDVLVSSVGSIILSTTQVAAAAAQTADGVTETTAAVEEVKQTAQVANLRAAHVSEGAQRSVQFSLAGRKSVGETMAGMSRIRTQMESIAGSIVRLGEQGQAIGQIISTVSDLAEQSNLLSVNAGIEAAEAGDQGKGFAVVAREVRSLADLSRQATAQVRGILGEVQKASGGAVMATEQGTRVVEAGVKQSLEVETAIRLLGESIQEAAREATQIADSSREQVVGIDQVALAMESIKAASSQNVESARQTEIAAKVLRDLGIKLQHAVEQYRL
jgi:methyl-accepting chemotaxis protein